MARLTPKQRRFVDEYLVDLKAGPAAIRAGYAPKTAETCGPRLLRFAQVADAIAKANAKRSDRVEITQDRVLLELAELAFSNITHYETDDDGNVTLKPTAPPNAERAIASIKRKVTTFGEGDRAGRTVDVEIKLWDKPGPLKLAGRHVGLFPNRVEVSAPGGKPLIPTTEEALDALRKLLPATAPPKPPEG